MKKALMVAAAALALLAGCGKRAQESYVSVASTEEETTTVMEVTTAPEPETETEEERQLERTARGI